MNCQRAVAGKKVAVACADVLRRCGTRATAQHILVDHELAVVFAHGAGGRNKTRIGRIAGGRPLPDTAKQLPVAIAGFRMEYGTLGKMAVRRPRAARRDGPGGHHLPLRFRRQPGSRPARKGIGLEVREVYNRLRRHKRLRAVQREFLPFPSIRPTPPIQRRLERKLGPPVPAFREPVLGVAIAAITHESQIFGVADEAFSQCKRLQEQRMAWRLVVEAKALPRMPDLYQAALVLHPARRCRGIPGIPIACACACGPVERPRWMARQQVLDVREHQFLVLLFVLQPQFDQCMPARAPFCEKRLHGSIHGISIAHHGIKIGPREQAALGPGVPLAHAVVIGIEQYAERRVERLEVARETLKHKGFEEPCRVRQVPLHGTCIGHGLRAAILGGQGFRQSAGRSTNPAVTARQVAPSGAGRRCAHREVLEVREVRTQHGQVLTARRGSPQTSPARQSSSGTAGSRRIRAAKQTPAACACSCSPYGYAAPR